MERQQEARGSLRWPIGIAIGLLLMVLVNMVFIYIAVSDADEVVPSYNTEER
jgi:ABC-type spermidine/putrescine transport system permease subunit I